MDSIAPYSGKLHGAGCVINCIALPRTSLDLGSMHVPFTGGTRCDVRRMAPASSLASLLLTQVLCSMITGSLARSHAATTRAALLLRSKFIEQRSISSPLIFMYSIYNMWSSYRHPSSKSGYCGSHVASATVEHKEMKAINCYIH